MSVRSVKQIPTRQHQVTKKQIVFAILDSQVPTVGIVQNVQLENSRMRLAIIHAQSAYKVNILQRLVPHQTSARSVYRIPTRQHQVTNIQIVLAMLDSLVMTVGIVQNAQLENLRMRLAIIRVQSVYKVNILQPLVLHLTSARSVKQIPTRHHRVTNIQIVFAMLDSQVITVGIVQNVPLENSSMRLAIIHAQRAYKVNILQRLVPHQTSARNV